MDTDPPLPPPPDPKKASKSTKKPKFIPKPPRRKNNAPVLPNRDSSDDNAEIKPDLLSKVNESLSSQGPVSEKKSSGNVATSHGAEASVTHDQKKDENSKNSSNMRDSSENIVMSSSSVATKDENIDNMLGDDKSKKSSKSGAKYEEPWNFSSNYPISLPLRPPGSGDPEVLNEEEFGEEKEYDETKINSAVELGLSESKEGKQLILFRFPASLPMGQQTHLVPVSSKGKEKVESSSPLKNNVGLQDLPDGYVGKMQVFKSGAIKLRLGDINFDVSSGIACECAQDAAMMNTETNNCCVLGPVNMKAMVTPDMNSIMENIDPP